MSRPPVRPLAVAVVSFNTRAVTLQCLRAAEAAVAGGHAALTVVDNGSTDGSVEAIRREAPAWSVIVRPDNPGYGAALNAAFRRTPARRYLALNSDVLVTAATVSALQAALDAHPDWAMVGPRLRYPDGRPQPSAKRLPGLGFALGEVCSVHALAPHSRWVRRFYYDHAEPPAPTVVEAVSGAAMLIRGDAFEGVGGFDERFRMYFEETDLCARLARAGFATALVAGATAVHQHAASSRQTSVRQVDYYLSYVRYFRKHRGRAAAVVLAAAVALATVARMLALPLKYPPLTVDRAAVLADKLGACFRLLRGVAS